MLCADRVLAPRSGMKSRRLTAPVPPVLPNERNSTPQYGRRLLHCGISIRPMPARGASLGTKDDPWADHGRFDQHDSCGSRYPRPEAHDNRLAGKLLSRLKSGTMLLADRGYDADWIRALATERGVWANIPPRCNRTTRSASARISTVPAIWSSGFSTRSNSVVASPLATNYLAFIQLASIRLWLRAYASAP
jgi:transposase